MWLFLTTTPSHVTRRMRSTLLAFNVGWTMYLVISTCSTKTNAWFLALSSISLRLEQQKPKYSIKGAWPRSRDPYKFWRTPEHISKKIRARHFKFGKQMHSGNISKTHKEKSRKGRGLGHVALINFGVPQAYLQNDYGWRLQIWCTNGNISKTCREQVQKRGTRPEKGHGIGHVTLIWHTLRRISKTCKHICKPLLKILLTPLR